MLSQIIRFSVHHKTIVLLMVGGMVILGTYALFHLPIGAVPDITNNQVQVITTSRNLSTLDIEQFITIPVELELANLPGVIEIRSVSKFGLSLVTVVFEEKMGTYLPRQLIAEKLKMAAEKIPEGFGTPEMGPISTGLGEIYQYVLDELPGYEGRYSAMELRTIQDWVVKRQLAGIPGVVEINTWGGYLKQYEVAIDPARLRALNLHVTQLFEALQKNNNIVGGSYIEKGQASYFIKGEGMVASLEDLGLIVVETRNGIPILIKDVAEVRFGHANRFGAITANGEGEKVMGQIMMLKGANSYEVIKAVKERVAAIQGTLPPGIRINPILERSELIDKTTATVTENLLIGCLIIIFVVVLMLGNMRSGLIIALVIPLSLLFAVSLMYLTGVDANLMSLGAIDFGIIIDGTVILVEHTAFLVTRQHSELSRLSGKARQSAMDDITIASGVKMMRPALFGQVIIMIVFLPILALSGVEGKMFKPMALTFIFALLGAVFLCFTFVPIVSSLFLQSEKKGNNPRSERFHQWSIRTYQPVLQMALRFKALTISLAVLLFTLAYLVFAQLGGEFIPTLDEGDFVIQPVLKTGTSLSATIAIHTQIEKILMQFPEVEQIVSRIGAAEIPTDPMSMEESDIIIKLKPNAYWESAKTKDGLAHVFKEALSVIPGMDVEFTQPIEMRFNELVTGVRADIAIKIYGENLDTLYQIGQQVQQLVRKVPGASDVILEKVVGLPLLRITYDRVQVARYGLQVENLNKILSMNFAGMVAGSVFEGEKRFDLVVRIGEDFRKDLGNIEQMYIPLPGGGQIPLKEVAQVQYDYSPAKISRDQIHRRAVVGVNVRDRDLESVVQDAQKLVKEHVLLPPGYRIDYGGQFQHLRNAQQRLMLVVPVSLGLIYILLFFAFRNLKDATLVFTAIPLAAIGGVFSLWLRDLPFSISAGIGFIALFGIAVLNGIVLIEEFNRLREEGMTDMVKVVKQGTQNRIRPVLLTALTDALGFLPMAVSVSAGAEVQRPLATVVIGGLVTATMLTLVVLPTLYVVFQKKNRWARQSVKAFLLLGLLTVVGQPQAKAQDKPMNLDQAIALAIQHHSGMKARQSAVSRQQTLVDAAVDLPKTVGFYQFDENNIAPNNAPIRVWGIQQSFNFPTQYTLEKQLAVQAYELVKTDYQQALLVLRKAVTKAFLQVQYWELMTQQYAALDSLYTLFAQAANRRFALGESNQLEQLTAHSKQQEMAMLYLHARRNTEASLQALHALIQTDSIRMVEVEGFAPWDYPVLPPLNVHPALVMAGQHIRAAELSRDLALHQMLPDFTVSYFQGTNQAPESRVYRGFQVGVALPLFYKPYKARVKAGKWQEEIALASWKQEEWRLQGLMQQKTRELEAVQAQLQFYEQTGRLISKELFQHSQRAFQAGEIDFLQYIQLLEHARNLEINYLGQVYQYNLAITELLYLSEP
jgi:cobalt-zinc-cadmium resistance protein CzcA